MDKKDFKELMKKCFGKEKNDRYHAVAMLAIYGVFMLFAIIFVRSIPSNPENVNNTNNQSQTTNNNTKGNDNQKLDDINDIDIENDINYSYSYTITFNDETETFLGKKIDTKEKITYIKDNNSTEYAILNDNFLMLKDDKYEIGSNPSRFFKYCDINKLISMTENLQNTDYEYQVTNKQIETEFKDILPSNTGNNNTIKFIIENDILTNIEMDLSNYINSLDSKQGETLLIKIKVTDVGTTEDFDINI